MRERSIFSCTKEVMNNVDFIRLNSFRFPVHWKEVSLEDDVMEGYKNNPFSSANIRSYWITLGVRRQTIARTCIRQRKKEKKRERRKKMPKRTTNRNSLYIYWCSPLAVFFPNLENMMRNRNLRKRKRRRKRIIHQPSLWSYWFSSLVISVFISRGLHQSSHITFLSFATLWKSLNTFFASGWY